MEYFAAAYEFVSYCIYHKRNVYITSSSTTTHSGQVALAILSRIFYDKTLPRIYKKYLSTCRTGNHASLPTLPNLQEYARNQIARIEFERLMLKWNSKDDVK